MKTINFINGSFTPEEVKEILCDMLNKNINLHNLKNFTSHIHFERPDPASEQSIKELKESRENLLTIIEEAKKKNLRLKIDSTIEISFEAQDQDKYVQWQKVAHSYKA